MFARPGSLVLGKSARPPRRGDRDMEIRSIDWGRAGALSAFRTLRAEVYYARQAAKESPLPGPLLARVERN